MTIAKADKKPLNLFGHGFDEVILITDQDRKFCELLATGQHNKTSARLAAGYPDLTAGAKTAKAKANANSNAAYKLAKKVEIQKLGEFLAARNMNKMSLTTEDLLKTSAAIMNTTMLDLIHLDGRQKKPHEIDVITARAIKKMKPVYARGEGGPEFMGYEYEFYDKLACQRNLIALQEIQLFKTRLEAKMNGRKLKLVRGGKDAANG